MKKTLLLCALLAATAANTYAGRRWNFSKWSDATVANLKADAAQWSDIEKSTGTAPTDLSKENCYWQVSASGSNSNGTLTANGVAIAELEGLTYVNTTDRSLAIALNYQGPLSDGFGPYQGASYLWLGSSKKNYFKIPNVEPGSEITIGIESHKTTDARGVELYVGSTSGTKLLDPEGNAVAVPTTYEEQTWLVPEELTDAANEDGTYDILIYNTNGCHLYFIQVGDDSEKTADQIRVAYVYDATYSNYGSAKMGSVDNDPIFQNVISSYDGIAIDVNNAKTEGLTTEAFKDSLLNFDVVVLGEGVASGNEYAKSIVDIVNMVPILNLKSFMYKSGVWSWGAGKNPSPADNTITVNEAFLEDDLFKDITIEDGKIQLFEISSDDITAGNLVQGYTVTDGSLIADDEVIATVSGINAIHRHGTTRNAYLLIPISSDNMYSVEDEDGTLSEDAYTLLNNAVTTLAATKSKVQNASAPTIKQDLEDGVTTVTIASTTADSKIYYTLDGSDPTTASTLYAEPFTVTVDSTVVNAIAVATGYNQSNTTTDVIRVKTKLATPAISVSGATVTITASDGTVYYNIAGNTNTAKSQVYTEPFEAPYSCTITAFAAFDEKLTSDAVSADVTVASDIYKNELEHVTFANAEGWNYTKSTKINNAYFAWSENPTDSTLVQVSADSSYYEYTYTPTDSIMEIKAETIDWTLTTKGQQLYYIADYNDALSVEGGSTAYGYASVFDNKDYTKYGIGFQNVKHVREEGVANAYLTSGKKYQAPFQVALTFTQAVGSGTNQTLDILEPGQTDVHLIARFEVAVSADGENWNVIDTIASGANKMAVRKTTVYNGTDEVQLRIRSIRPLNLVSSSNQKAILFDVVINGEGEASAIETINADKVATAAVAAPVYDLMGRRVLKLESGKLYLQGGKKFIMK
jgi:hypothetical protein